MREEQTTIYRADDGTEFKREYDCREYERRTWDETEKRIIDNSKHIGIGEDHLYLKGWAMYEADMYVVTITEDTLNDLDVIKCGEAREWFEIGEKVLMFRDEDDNLNFVGSAKQIMEWFMEDYNEVFGK